MITTDKFVLQCVRGFKIPFMRKPRQIFPPPPQNWTDDEVIALRADINSLLEMKVITPCISEDGEFLSTFFLVSRPNGSKRFIFNVKKLNEFVEVPHYKIEDLRTASKLMAIMTTKCLY